MDTWAWVVIAAVAVLTLVAVGVLRERRAGKNRINFDPNAPRGQADSEFRTREGPGGTFGGGF